MDKKEGVASEHRVVERRGTMRYNARTLLIIEGITGVTRKMVNAGAGCGAASIEKRSRPCLFAMPAREFRFQRPRRLEVSTFHQTC